MMYTLTNLFHKLLGKRKQSAWMRGLLYAEEYFKKGGNPCLNEYLWSIGLDFDEFSKGARDYNSHLIRRGLK